MNRFIFFSRLVAVCFFYQASLGKHNTLLLTKSLRNSSAISMNAAKPSGMKKNCGGT